MISNPIVFQRLRSQRLVVSNLHHPEEVVSWLGVVQAQDYAGGKWTIGLRAPGLAEADVEQAVRDRRILRTWTLRGTLHFVCAQDIRWMLGLMAPRVIAGNARRYHELELDEAVMNRASDLMAEALRDGQELLRTQLLDVLRRQGISTQGQRAAYLLQRASLDGWICQTGVRSNNPLYRSLADVVPTPAVLSRTQAAAELARRYFTSHGPATLQDFTSWTGLLSGEARAGLEAVKTELVEEIYEAKRYWCSASAPPWQEPEGASTAFLLPGYDEYLIGYSDRSAMLDQVGSQSVNLGNGMSPTFAIDGRIAGIWKRIFRKGKVVVNCTPFQSMSEVESSALSSAVARYTAFLGMPLG